MQRFADNAKSDPNDIQRKKLAEEGIISALLPLLQIADLSANCALAIMRIARNDANQVEI